MGNILNYGKKMNDKLKKIFTIPNILSLFRLILIPIIVYCYRVLNEVWWSVGLLVLSAVTDVVDGFIARKFNMGSSVGQILDPVADKLTQLAVMAGLCFTFPMMAVPAVMLVVKEVASGIVALVMLSKTKKTLSSEWHGKLATAVIYATMIVHIIWGKESLILSQISITFSVCAMILSFVLYIIKYVNIIKKTNE